jgi:hypothetical protein
MTPKKFLLIFILQWLFFTLLKSWFFENQIFANQGLQQVVFWSAIIIITAALVRRFGPITFLEAFILVVVWTLGDLLLDLIFTTPFTGMAIFYTSQYWFGLLVMDVSLLVLHKMRHIHVRHQMHAHH